VQVRVQRERCLLATAACVRRTSASASRTQSPSQPPPPRRSAVHVALDDGVIADRDDPGQIIARLMGALPAGSFLVISHFTADFNPRLAFFSQHGVPAPGPVVLRTRQQILQLFTGLELLEPGLVPTSQWRPGTDHQASAPSTAWVGVARTT
jgi:hypothetical protein